MLVEAELPPIHAGGGALWSGAYEEIRELPEDHPLYLIPASPGALTVQNEADVVLLVGSMLGDIDFWGKPPGWPIETQKFIQIDIDPEMIALNRPVDLAIIGDAKLTLRLLIKEVKKLTDKIERDISYYKKLTEEWERENVKLALANYDGIHPLRIVYEVRNFFPRNAISVVDGGNVPVWAHYLNRIFEPRTFLWAANSGHLGTGLSYALGAKLAAPERPVYLLTGDGSLMFNIQELETATRLGAIITIIVFNDRAYGMIKGAQKQMFKGRYIGVDFYDVRYDKVAEAMGWYGERVVDPEEIRPALEGASESGKPALLDIVTPTEISIEPPDLSIIASLWLEGCIPPER